MNKIKHLWNTIIAIFIAIIWPFIQSGYLYFADASKTVWYPEVHEILWGLILALIVYLVGELIKQIKLNKKYFTYYLADNTYSWIFKAHQKLPKNIQNWIENKILSHGADGGLIFLNVCDGIYLDWLTGCIENAKNSLKCILTYPYSPDWFFNEDNMPQEEKLKYLDIINEGSKKLEKIRILIYEQKDLEESFKKMGKNNTLITFFKKHENVDLYYIDKKKLDEITFYADFKENIKNAISSDFAMIDESFVLRKTGEFELAFYYNDNNDFKNLFDKDKYWITYHAIIKNKNEIINDFNLKLN